LLVFNNSFIDTNMILHHIILIQGKLEYFVLFQHVRTTYDLNT